MQKVRRHRPRPTRRSRSPAPTACRHPVSGSVSPPSSGCFSPFPHGTGSLSVVEEYLGLEGGPPIFGQGFTCPALLEDERSSLPVRGCHPLWPAVPDGSGSRHFRHWPGPRSLATTRGVSPPALSRRKTLLMSFPPGTEMFQFPGFASHGYGFTARYSLRSGLPHSDIPGSTGARTSPGLIAACHVLHRLSTPRHPPDALPSRPPPQRQDQRSGDRSQKDRCQMTERSCPLRGGKTKIDAAPRASAARG